MTRNDIGVRIRCKADELYSAPEKEKIMAKSELGSMTDAKKRAEMSVLASFYGNLLTERQREIVTATCNYDVSLGENRRISRDFEAGGPRFSRSGRNPAS